jgi:hypothetical protein
LRVIFTILDPDQDSESGSTDLTESGSETLFFNSKLDTQHWDGSGIRKKLITDPGIKTAPYLGYSAL